jgi:hypothetical protein
MVKRNSKSKDGLNRNVDGKTIAFDEKLAVIRERRVQEKACRMNLQELEASEVSIDGRNFPPGIRVIETVMFTYDYSQVLTNVIGIETMSAEARALLVRLLGVVYQVSSKREIEELFYDLNEQSYWAMVQELDTHKYVSLIQKENDVHHTLLVCDGPKRDVVEFDGKRLDPIFDRYEQDGLSMGW